MHTSGELQALFSPLFPGLMGIQLKEATAERLVATMRVRPDLCTTGEALHGGAPRGSTVTGECVAFHRGRTTMVWQTQVRTEDGKLCALVTQTQLVIPG